MFGDIFDNLKKMEEEVAKAEKTFDDHPSDSNRSNMKKAYSHLDQALSVEEAYWRQKAACRWIEDGERNTKLFLSLVNKKRTRSWIHSITHDGNTYTSQEDIAKSASHFLEKLLTTCGDLFRYALQPSKS